MKRTIISGEDGFVLVFTLLLMVVLMLLGTSAIDTAVFESEMSVNDALYKQAFYEADGGTEVGLKLTYDNAICVQVNGGFNTNSGPPGTRTINGIIVNDLDFSSVQSLASTDVSDTNRAAVYYTDGVLNDTSPHTNLLFNGKVAYSPGSGLQMISGYEGLGASSAAGGSHMKFTIYSRHQGSRESDSLVTLGWRLSTHILNNASTSDCDAATYRN